MQTLVGLTQLQECRSEECLVFVSLAGTQGCQSVQANVYAYCWCSGIGRIIQHFYRKTDEPPICCSCHTCAFDFALEPKVLCHIHPSEFGYPDAMIPKLELIIGKVKACFAALLAFELRSPLLFPLLVCFKEVRKCLAQIEKRLIGSVFGDFPGPGKLLPSDLVELLFKLQRGGFLACCVSSVPLRKRPIPHKSRCSSSFRKIHGLLRRGIQSDLVCLDHP